MGEGRDKIGEEADGHLFERQKSCMILSGKEEPINRAGVRVHQHAFVINVSKTLHIVLLIET